MNPEFTIEKWDGRHWALFDGDELICLTVYKKGALEVKRRLEQRRSQEASALPTAASSDLDPVPHLSLPSRVYQLFLPAVFFPAQLQPCSVALIVSG